MYDVAIIGLGPAGSTLARLLSRNLKVIALDKKHSRGDEGFHKPCGGLLAPDAQKALSRFHLTLPLDVLVSPQIFSVRTIDINTGIVRHYQRFYVNLDRHRFDLWLKSLIPEHVEIRHDTRCAQITPMQGDCGYQISFMQQGRPQYIEARYLVGADGAGSLVRKTFYPNAGIRTYLSIQQWFKDLHTTPFYSCVFDSDTTDCYAWGLSKGDSFIFGGAFKPHNARERFEELKRKLHPYGFQLEDPYKTEACLVLRPEGLTDCFSGRNGIFLIGEAAGLVSPSSLEGISHAFNSALELSSVLNTESGDPNRLYCRRMRKIKHRLVMKNLKSPFMYFPPLRRVVMGSGIASIKVLPG